MDIKLAVVFALVVFSALVWPTHQSKRSRIVGCSSWKSKPKQCNVFGKVVSVTLKKELSKSKCKLGKTFGAVANKIWVKKGCNGIFGVILEPTQERSRIVVCSSWRSKPKKCNVFGKVVSVTLKKELSKSKCKLGKTFGASGNKIWVKKGCKGIFGVKLAPKATTTAAPTTPTTTAAPTTTPEATTTAAPTTTPEATTPAPTTPTATTAAPTTTTATTPAPTTPTATTAVPTTTTEPLCPMREFDNVVIANNNYHEIRGISAEECKKACQTDPTKTCKTAEYNKVISRCFFSKKTYERGRMEFLLRISNDFIMFAVCPPADVCDFDVYDNTVIAMNNVEPYMSLNMTLDECRYECNLATEYTCRSFEYNRVMNRCFPSVMTYAEGKDQHLIRTSGHFVMYSCPDAEATTTPAATITPTE